MYKIKKGNKTEIWSTNSYQDMESILNDDAFGYGINFILYRGDSSDDEGSKYDDLNALIISYLDYEGNTESDCVVINGVPITIGKLKELAWVVEPNAARWAQDIIIHDVWDDEDEWEDEWDNENDDDVIVDSCDNMEFDVDVIESTKYDEFDNNIPF